MERADGRGPGVAEKQVLDLLAQAEGIFAEDVSLYKLEIAYSPPEVKEATKSRILNKILTLTMIPSRVDTLYFVQLALASGSKELAARWIKQAKIWYPDSRTLKQFEANGYENAR